ncbi:MAG TPA: hypothetical protein EYQ51_01630 [Alphaproteobacteria bacterium]|nr:hypothetical protein [Alphaproteobacteria bacterium]
MSEIIDLGSPDRELSAGDIKRKQKKLERTTERLKDTPTGTRKRHRLEFKQLKTQAQIKTGMSGIHVDKKPFKVSHQADLQQDDNYYGVSRKKSALNMLGIKSSPLNQEIPEGEWGTGKDLSQPFAGSGNVPTANPFDVQPSGQDENTTNPSWEKSITDEEWTDMKSKDGPRAQQAAFQALKTKYKKN